MGRRQHRDVGRSRLGDQNQEVGLGPASVSHVLPVLRDLEVVSQELIGEEAVEDAVEGASVLVVGHTPAVVALPRAVPQGLERNLVRGVGDH